jgi:Ca-activated chloride channel family protein
MSFVHPYLAVTALAALVLLGWLTVRSRSQRLARLRRFGDPALLERGSALPSATLVALRQLLKVGAIALVILSLARPQFGMRESSRAQTGRDMLVLLDLSRSMNAGDVGGSRLQASKETVVELLSRSPGSRVGLIVFGGSAFLQMPLTTDHGAFRRFLEAGSTDDIANPATDLSRALSAAVTTFEHEGERGFQTVVLVSDGESMEGDMGPVLKRLRTMSIPVFALGVGTEAGAPIPADTTQSTEQWHRDHIGRIVQSRLEEGEMRRAALETGGAYLRWGPGVGARLGSQLARLEKRTLGSRSSSERAEQFQWPLGLAILMLGVEPLIGRRRRNLKGARYVAIVLGAATLQSSCAPGWWQSRNAERLYSTGNYREAYGALQQAFDASGEPGLHYDIGVVLYRMKQYENAAKSFREAAVVPELKQKSQYNLGNTLVRMAEEAPEKDELLRLAIGAYEEALRLQPSDSLAKWNLELALQRRGEDRESGGSSGRGRSADAGQGNMNVPGYEGNPEAAVGAMAGGGYGGGEGESAEELSEAEARALLEAVEREQLTTHEGRPAIGGAAAQKDW